MKSRHLDQVLYVQRGNDDYLGSLAEHFAVKHQLGVD